jgi:hypothetical protein
VSQAPASAAAIGSTTPRRRSARIAISVPTPKNTSRPGSAASSPGHSAFVPSAPQNVPNVVSSKPTLSFSAFSWSGGRPIPRASSRARRTRGVWPPQRLRGGGEVEQDGEGGDDGRVEQQADNP